MSVFTEERAEIRQCLISDVNCHQEMQHHLLTEIVLIQMTCLLQTAKEVL